MAVELATGEIAWKTPNPGGWAMTHSSITPMDFKGTRHYIYCGSLGVVGVSASDGAVLWKTTDWRVKIANVPSPVLLDGDRIFFSGGYNAGAAMFQLTQVSGGIVPKELYRLEPDVFGAPQPTPIYYSGYLYGIVPDGQLVCLDPAGRRLWSSGSNVRFGLGPFLIADGLILALSDMAGTLHLAEAGPAGYKELAQAKVLNGHDAWAPMALVNGKLILRDYDHMVCLKVGSRTP
jgi:outer membrane protein assembly factor BamB